MQNKVAGLLPGIISNAVIFSALACVAWIYTNYPDLYYLSVQEDEFLEWATFWSFALATGMFLWAATCQKRNTDVLPWFLACVALFCFVVAMEEISWAQRIFGYRPPVYFLAENFQQELNFHNFFAKGLRKLLLHVILFGYGILLPVLACVPLTRRLLDGMGVVSPPLALLPVFVAALFLSIYYPWRFTNETVEFMMGAGFLFASLITVVQFSAAEVGQRYRNSAMGVVICTALVAALAMATVAMARYGRSHDPRLLGAAMVEIEALKQDFLAMAERDDETFPNRKNLQKRVYSYQKKYGADYLYNGLYAGLVSKGLPEERAGYFLDPWNTPYWIKLRWSPDQSITAFVYSFGPNRRRDSLRLSIQGDDVGDYIFKDMRVRR